LPQKSSIRRPPLQTQYFTRILGKARVQKGIKLVLKENSKLQPSLALTFTLTFHSAHAQCPSQSLLLLLLCRHPLKIAQQMHLSPVNKTVSARARVAAFLSLLPVMIIVELFYTVSYL
jgi:hypothetical protein